MLAEFSDELPGPELATAIAVDDGVCAAAPVDGLVQRGDGQTRPSSVAPLSSRQNQFLCRAIASDLAGQSVTLNQVQTARARRNAFKNQLSNRRSLVDALPADNRFLADAPTAPPAATVDEPLPAHGLRTYASD